jgi:large subunit ribosomal protein L23
VRRKATKDQIKRAIEYLFDVEVAHVNTRITKNGKHAIVTFTPEYNAEDIGMRIGVF